MDNLAACALAARKMGLSYGQYMATKEGRTIVQKPAVDLPVEDMHYCKECGKPFHPSKRLLKYCSPECRAHNNARRNMGLKRKRAKIKPDDVLVCPYCNTEFVRGDRHGSMKYCSPECSKAAKKEQQKKWRYTNGKA